MSASVGPQGGPRPPTAPASMPDMPDLSHLTEEERKIIMAVMARQREEEEKEQAMLNSRADVNDGLKGVTEHVGVAKDHSVKEVAESAGVWKRAVIRVYQQWLKRTLHQQFESYKEQVRRIGAETKRQQTIHKDDAPTCGICRKTKFADGCGHLCSYCQTKFCARCGGRVSSSLVQWSGCCSISTVNRLVDND
ncbi:hypothetical protein NFI96_006937 [Prochilodus magdalenae]|nr:hypothetical protein NFI96_006937 [Prochilodus magdalenae]